MKRFYHLMWNQLANMAGIPIGTFLIVLLLSIAAPVGGFVGAAGPPHARRTVVNFHFSKLERPAW